MKLLLREAFLMQHSVNNNKKKGIVAVTRRIIAAYQKPSSVKFEEFVFLFHITVTCTFRHMMRTKKRQRMTSFTKQISQRNSFYFTEN